MNISARTFKHITCSYAYAHIHYWTLFNSVHAIDHVIKICIICELNINHLCEFWPMCLSVKGVNYMFLSFLFDCYWSCFSAHNLWVYVELTPTFSTVSYSFVIFYLFSKHSDFTFLCICKETYVCNRLE